MSIKYYFSTLTSACNEPAYSCAPYYMGQELRTKFHLSRNHALKTVIIKNILGVHSCITRASVNQVCHGVMSAVCQVSIHLILLRFSVTR